MNRISILAFFILAGMLVGYFVNEPIYGTIAGIVFGILLYFFIPEKKKNKARRVK